MSAKPERHHHHHGLYRRGRQLLFPAAAGRKIPGLGAGHDLRDRQERGRSTAARKQDFTLNPLADFVRQLPGDDMIASLPEDTPDDKRMKTLVRNNCTGCHTPSYTLQHKFDETGWNAILDLMKHVNVYGTYVGKSRSQRHARSPSEGNGGLSRARPRAGRDLDEDQARPASVRRGGARGDKEYDVPLEPDAGLPSNSFMKTAATGRRGRRPSDPRLGRARRLARPRRQIWFTSNPEQARPSAGSTPRAAR